MSVVEMSENVKMFKELFVLSVCLLYVMCNIEMYFPLHFLSGSGGVQEHYCKVSGESWSSWQAMGESGAPLGYFDTMSLLHEAMSGSDVLSTSTNNPRFFFLYIPWSA